MTTTTAPPTYREQALALAEELAGQLRDPASLPQADHGTGPDERWKVSSLASGHAGIALLFSERSLRDPAERLTAHRYASLAAASLETQPAPHHGLLYEVAGLGFALHLASQAGGGYGRALAALDARAGAAASALSRLVDTVPLGPMARYDVLDGLAGLGRYLLLRGLGGSADMEQLLTSLVGMTGPADHHGQRVPRYWSVTPPNWHPATDPALVDHGHLNLGLAHGIAGPLALLAIAHRHGAVVDGQREAVESLVALLDRFQDTDEYGPFWPPTVSLSAFGNAEPGRARGRTAWCYGAPGISRALQIAGQAMGRADWLEQAHASIAPLTRLPLESFGTEHWSLCHGWSGVLHLLGYFTDGPHAAPVRGLRDTIAGRIIEEFEADGPPRLQLGYDGLADGSHPAGFLEGTAGLALALNHYARPEESLPWDIALLLN
ncbi:MULTISPECIES: lanthionine synthetase C family protein [unclassified Kitasatospora]|uniref:lanthionine synthetase C family protein n=1 Tax=unclassified Kitasatospora TaxID=2633591 RepID=UPI0037F407FE